MQMTGQRILPVPPQQTWDALNDPEMLKACIPGCESIVQTEPNRYEVLMAARIGPVSARFKGRLTQSDVVPPQSYRLEFDGQGGAAGFGKGGATVRLSPVEAGTQLDYEANAQVGGKLAQIGSRLVDSAARKIADDFFANFEAKLVERQGAAGDGYAAAPGSGSGVAPAPVAAAEVLLDRDAIGAVADAAADEASGPSANAAVAAAPGERDRSADTAAAIAAGAAGPLAAATLPPGDGGPGPTAAAPSPVRGEGGSRWLPWAIVAVVVIALVLWYVR